MPQVLDIPAADAVGAATGNQIVFSKAGKKFFAHGKEIRALLPIDLAVGREEILALVGPSGCGKSTCLNLVAGQLPPSEGWVSYDGEKVTGLNHRVGYMTQKDTLLPWRTTADNMGASQFC
jgi:NitT/TauT family transport system ATP-binding protein